MPLEPPGEDEHPSSLAHPIPVDPSGSPVADSLASAFDVATRGDGAISRTSRQVLVLFSGDYARPDGLSAFLSQLGLNAVLVDNDPVKGDARHDILDDSFFHALLERVRSGEFCAIFAAPPCSTFSVSRFFTSANGPPPVRDRSNILGLPSLPGDRRKEVRLSLIHI